MGSDPRHSCSACLRLGRMVAKLLSNTRVEPYFTSSTAARPNMDQSGIRRSRSWSLSFYPRAVETILKQLHRRTSEHGSERYPEKLPEDGACPTLENHGVGRSQGVCLKFGSSNYTIYQWYHPRWLELVLVRRKRALLVGDHPCALVFAVAHCSELGARTTHGVG